MLPEACNFIRKEALAQITGDSRKTVFSIVKQPIWNLSFGIIIFATYPQNQNPAAMIL